MKRTRFLSLMAMALMSTQLQAQQCKTDSLIINTGYDAVAHATLATGAADPEWRITSFTPDLLNPSKTTLGFTPTPGAATVADGVGGATDVNSRWLSFYDAPGATWTSWYKTLVPGEYSFMIQRNFTVVCGQTDVTVDLKIARDNYVLGIKILDASNVVIWSTTLDPVITVDVPAYYNAFQQIPVFTLPGLAPGTYHIELDVHNLHLNNVSPPPANPHGVNIVGLLTAASGNLLAPGNTDCNCECSDKCYWKVEGNNILNGNNIFGTLSAHDIRIKTENNDRGIIKAGNAYNGGFLGWNTMSPTARLHVNCANGNQQGGLSDIRFENLEPGSGNILVIDDKGYVYNSQVNLKDLVQKAVQAEMGRAAELEQEVRQLREELTVMKGGNTGSMTPETATSMLYQNIPNPFGTETVIPYYIKSMQRTAALAVYDVNGRELSRYAITEAGKGNITLNAKDMIPGNYLYSLIIDGQKIDTKKMTLAK